jgi:hypothetical protein
LNEWNGIEYRPKVAIKPHLKPLDIADIRYAWLRQAYMADKNRYIANEKLRQKSKKRACDLAGSL